MVNATLFLAVGLTLLLLVRFQYVIFLWPLALLACGLVLFRIWSAHAAMSYAREGFAAAHILRRYV